jgi:hypothetical protein
MRAAALILALLPLAAQAGPVATTTTTPIYATATPEPTSGSASIPGNLFHPLRGQPLQLNYSVPYDGMVTIKIYSRNGQLVKSLQSDRSAGSWTESWDGRADDGNWVSSGVYAAYFKGKGLSKTLKLVVVK